MGRRDVSIDSRVRCQCSVPVGTDAGHAYGMEHASSRGERFRPQQAQPYGQMAVQWLTWESNRTGYSIRHQVNGREKRIGKLPVDGWCSKTHTEYQFHGCYSHGCPKCCDENEMNSVNGMTMAELLANTKTHTAFLRRFVDVVEMWECEWKGKRIESDTKRFINAEFPRRSTRIMTQHQILAAVVDGILFGMVECDVCVPRELQDHFAEMQPITVTRNDIGPFMRDYAGEHDIMSATRRMLVSSYRHDNILLSAPLLQWYLMHAWTYCGLRVPSCRVRTEAMLPTLWLVGFHGSTCGRRRPRQICSAIRGTGRRSQTSIATGILSIARRLARRR